MTITDEQVIQELQRARGSHSAVELAELLGRTFPGGLSQGALVMFFKRAFPEIPLRTLLDVGAWHRVSGGDMSDSEFEEVLSPWLGRNGSTAWLDAVPPDRPAQ